MEAKAPFVAVEVAGICKRWPQHGLLRRSAMRTSVLSDITFSATGGEIVALLAENGAGKSTLLKIIAGLTIPDAGRVRLLGHDAASTSARGTVAYAGGERGFYYRLTVRQNLAFFGALDGLRRRECDVRIVDVARTVDIEHELDRRFSDLSSGVRQRLSIARALLADPDVLLLDEPTRALDPPHASDLRRFVRETLAARFGKTVRFTFSIKWPVAFSRCATERIRRMTSRAESAPEAPSTYRSSLETSPQSSASFCSCTSFLARPTISKRPICKRALRIGRPRAAGRSRGLGIAGADRPALEVGTRRFERTDERRHELSRRRYGPRKRVRFRINVEDYG